MDSNAVSRANRFDLLRLVFAGLVALAHLHALPGEGPYSELDVFFFSLSEWAVQGFFVLSGALVYGSLQRSDDVTIYAVKRVRRLYPAYAVVVVLCALLALVFSPEARNDIVGVLEYLGANLIFLNFLAPDLPGIFEGHRFTAVNGALWTIKIEVMFYLILPVLVFILNKTGKLKYALMAMIYIAAEIWRGVLEAQGEASGSGLIIQLSRQLPGQMSFFIAGMVLWDFRDVLRAKWLAAILLGLALMLASILASAEFIRAAGFALFIAGLAFAPGPELNPARFGDLSYGVYITHFPIIQALIATGLFSRSEATANLAAVILTLFAALTLWHLIEKNALRRDSWYREKSR